MSIGGISPEVRARARPAGRARGCARAGHAPQRTGVRGVAAC